MSKNPDPTATLQGALKEGMAEVKKLGNQGLARAAVMGLQAKGIDMMLSPETDVMSVPGLVKDGAGMLVKTVEEAGSGLLRAGGDAFKKLLPSGGSHHTGAPSHGLAHAAPADEQGKVR